MKRKLPLMLLCVAFLAMTLFFGSRLLRQQKEYKAGQNAYETLTQYVQLPTAPPVEEQPEMLTPAAPEVVPEEADPGNWPAVDFEALQAINPDIVAWIYIEGTNINYPVVQGQDNSRYLNRLFDGGRNSAGTIFMDYRNQGDLSDTNTVLYGHHMRNGTMFQPITQYKKQSFYDEHPRCLVMTADGNYTLDFFAGYVTDLNDDAWDMEFESEEAYSRWLEDAIDKSTFTATLEPGPQDRVMTFSTCTYEYNDARYVLVGVLKPATP